MPDAARPWNSAIFWALLLAIGALATNFVFFLNPPMQATLPWLNLVVTLAALVSLGVGIRRAIIHWQNYRGRALSIALGVFALILAGASLFISSHARALPNAAAAPQVGQQLPDFTLEDTNGQQVSLESLFQPPPSDPSSPVPKDVLLIFYRGYW
jgi:hypothetical protein